MRSIGSIVAISFITAGMLLWVVLDKGLTSLWALLGWINAPMIGATFTTTTLIALAIAVVATGVTWRHPTVNGLSREVVQELKKVSWPNWLETRASTQVVIAFSFILAAILGVFDYVFAALSDGLFSVGRMS
ncbi:MAG: preprotein translocase subunit SecE [Pseudomonadota bacterium]